MTPTSNKKKTLLLSFHERIILSGLLPQAGSKLEQMIVRTIIDKVEIKEDESKIYKVKLDGNRILWDANSVKGKEFPIQLDETEVSIIKEVSRKIDGEKRVTQENLPLLEQIDNL